MCDDDNEFGFGIIVKDLKNYLNLSEDELAYTRYFLLSTLLFKLACIFTDVKRQVSVFSSVWQQV